MSEFFRDRSARAHNELPALAAMLGRSAPRQVQPYLALWPKSAPTPLHRLRGLAETLGTSSLFLKDEGQRLGLGSFKALGGAYAVMRIVQEVAENRLGHPVPADELTSRVVRQIATSLTFACASDGNHGKSVAAGAQLLGSRASIFLHAGVSEPRIRAVRDYGADIIRVAGTYDDSVEEAARVSKEQGWHVISDTSWPGYERIPLYVSQGYTVLAEEALGGIEPSEAPTHVFLQAGVGGFASAIAAYLIDCLGSNRPRFIIVEPERAACLMASAQRGQPVRIEPAGDTVMAMLECYQPSLVAWQILASVADAFLTVSDSDAMEAMRILARPPPGDPPIVAGESGAAGLAGLLRVARTPAWREEIGLGADSRVLVINTESATDPISYERIVGQPPG